MAHERWKDCEGFTQTLTSAIQRVTLHRTNYPQDFEFFQGTYRPFGTISR
jgi:hypothetical protein